MIFGLIIDSIRKNEKNEIKRLEIHKFVEINENYVQLIRNLGFNKSEILKKQYEGLIDNNLGKLIKNGVVKINGEKKYCLTAHGDELWVKYNKDWYSMPPLNKQYIVYE